MNSMQSIYQQQCSTKYLVLRVFNFPLLRHAYPRYPDIDQIQDQVTPEERQYTLDLRPVMNPTPPSIVHATPLPQVFQLFRAIGLRHLIVTNDESEARVGYSLKLCSF